jgi:uncharacterized protein YyaL (SSP411 family)
MNSLSNSRSPYLLQHASNPVNWFEWGEEAFAIARREEKPIFLSIGYSTCHWCHVMAHESFEDASVAAALNRAFVSVKVDREERPDVDRVYMAFVQATTGAGGWPMSVWLTPELRPFFGGTYFPPAAQWGRPGFIDVLREIERAWRDERPRVLQSAETILSRLHAATGGDGAAPDRAPVAGVDAVRSGIDAYAQAFDARHGGFGGAPKFPRPSELLFLLNAYAQTGDDRAKRMALESLRAMAMGGLHDHLGGGFHRYSVDAEWRIPHFEKMLYDQAQLVIAYLEAAQVSGESMYALVAEETLNYVHRDLTGPEGAFLSAEDADSPVPGGGGQSGGGHHDSREGAFYVWPAAEIDALLGADAPVIRRRFGIEDQGNAPSDPQGEFIGLNHLYIAQSIEDVAARTDRGVDEVMAAVMRGRTKLFEAREARPRPHRDDKVIAAWNGLMIAAMARAAHQLVDSPRRSVWRAAALRAGEFARTTLWDAAARRLRRRYRDSDAAIDGFCEDYACQTWGALELFQLTGDATWLDWAVELVAVQTELFFDEVDGGWFSTTGADSSVLLRLKEDYDGAEPAASSVTVRNLIRLSQLTGDAQYLARAQRTFERYGPGLGQVVRVMPFMMANIALWHARRSEVVLVGRPGSADLAALESVVARRYLPWAVEITINPSASAPALPWLAAMEMRDDRATAYVCQDFACQAPTTDPAVLDRQLEEAAAPRRIIVER